MPYRNEGCLTCKSRRIKCDGGKPKCQRCTKSRRFCLDANAASLVGLTIHVENCYASGEIKRPRGPRSGLTLHRPHYDLQSRALDYYLNYHMQTLTDAPHVLGCLSGSVSAWKLSGRSCGMVDLALSAIALAVFSKTQHYPPAIAEASSRYCQLLRLTRHQIARLQTAAGNSADFDACLLTVLLMNRYEGVVYHSSDRNPMVSFMSPKSWSHHEGAMAILRVWNEKSGQISPSTIIKESRRGLIGFSILRDLSLPDWILDGELFGERDFELEYDRMTTRMVKLRSALKGLLGKNCLQDVEAEKLIRKACKLDTAWRGWAAQCPSAWSYQLHNLAESGQWPRRHFYSSKVFTYSRPGYAALWSQYFAARMLISSTVLKALTLLCESNSCFYLNIDQQRLDCITQLETMANSLASTIPFCLDRLKLVNSHIVNTPALNTVNTTEDIKPYLASCTVWPLAIASSIEEIAVPQQQWFRSELATVGKILCDGVLSVADTDQWISL